MKEILINPTIPNWMDSRDIRKRSNAHMKKWFNVPYIETENFIDDTYEDYCERCLGMELETEQEFDDRRLRDRESWCNTWGADGIRYDVRCLDGGAWDRTTNHGSFKTLEEALEKARSLLN